jgi:hypothetical protein
MGAARTAGGYDGHGGSLVYDTLVPVQLGVAIQVQNTLFP